MAHPNNGMLFIYKYKGTIKLWKNRNPKWVLLSERGQSTKAAYDLMSTIWHLEKDKTVKTIKISVFVEGLGRDE